MKKHNFEFEGREVRLSGNLTITLSWNFEIRNERGREEGKNCAEGFFPASLFPRHAEGITDEQHRPDKSKVSPHSRRHIINISKF